MISGSAKEIVLTLLKRDEVIETVQAGARDKRSVLERVSDSRSTVDRAVRELSQNGLLDTAGNRYALTRYGELCLQAYREFVSAIEKYTEMKPILREFPKDTPLPADVIDDADVTLAADHAPYQIVRCLLADRDPNQSLDVVCAVYLPSFGDFFRETILEAGIEATITFPTQVREFLASQDPTLWSDLDDASNCTIRVVDESPGFNLVIVDDREVGLVVMSDQGAVVGTLQNDTAAAVNWAKEAWERRLTNPWESTGSIGLAQ